MSAVTVHHEATAPPRPPAPAASGRCTPATSGPSSPAGSWPPTSNWLVMLSGFFEPVLYLLAMGVGLGADRRHRAGPGRRGDLLRGVHRPGAAGRVRDERRDLRLHVERLLQDELRQALPGHAGHLAGAAGRRDRRDLPGAAARGLCTPPASPPSWASWG